MLAFLSAPAGVGAILEHLGLPAQAPKLAPARGPPQQQGLHSDMREPDMNLALLRQAIPRLA
ncbi:hypothetical protein [Vitiosangium sp. GDMCC 1.1324]|uniref:hypothetical protein n=1 Tax=Vitiosangium sp. (strain GDMCC 1.1324) TaxID=2138576 RepID=UPI0018EE847E|nr:hypothetical protein [Vitiosangium sp. GDMCC 1.1324]